ncbi:MAG: S-methyl-5-thioribose-1-phosphate isomerase [Candidatus Bathyarchaeota archaeon]|nr:S-methyl-5-thioribose-1-phosphate isomerase [Candidatus Bathyarchaeota archaeon]MDH5746744.1 S-methyl-5-thioribose-1-phosphate isomerase [Candidatus Bathyarchaeota archaeon]
MLESIETTATKIKRLEVQGARNIAIVAIKAMETLAQETKAKNKKAFLEELSEAKEILFASRETEPLMRNAVRWIINQVERGGKEKVRDLAKIVSLASQRFLKNLEDSKERIAEIGARRIRNRSVILTHCHSSTVTYLLNKARSEEKFFRVICTETRPIFQGRITAKEMLELGVDTTLIVDSAARFFMNQADFVIVGADAITSEGNVINKIGTSMIALLAQEARTPFYVVSELLKFDPATMYGDYEKIEERNPNEIWKDPPENLTIRNPAFDITRRDFIHGIICEEGIISPHSVIGVMHRKYPWVFE